MNGEEPEEIFAGRACAWPRRPKGAGRVRLIAPGEVGGWILHEDDELLVVDKPGEIANGRNMVTEALPSPAETTADFTKTGLLTSSPSACSTRSSRASRPTIIAW